jgi:hypothetical protein
VINMPQKRTVKKPIKNKKTTKVKNSQKLKKSIKDCLGDKFKEFKIEAKRPKHAGFGDEPWSGNIYRYSF